MFKMAPIMLVKPLAMVVRVAASLFSTGAVWGDLGVSMPGSSSVGGPAGLELGGGASRGCCWG